MGAIGMLARAAWRRHWRASLFLALVAGLAAGVVGASFQAAARASTSLERFTIGSRVYDEVAQGCPPEVSKADIDAGKVDPATVCANPTTTERFRRVVDHVKGVERTAVASLFVVALLDPSVSNHWGRLTLLFAVRSKDALPAGRPVIVDGRLYDPAASDEVVVSEDAAKATGLHVGDVVRMAGWHRASLDAGIDGTVKPQTPAFSSRVVGVVRALDDVQAAQTGDLSDGIPGDFNVYAGPAWTAAHGGDLAGYGSSVLVRLRDGPSSARAFESEMNKAPGGWFNQASPASDVDPTSVRRVIDLERRALLAFAFIAIVAGAVFVGLTGVRQLRRESTETPRLVEMGMARRDLRVVNVIRALSIAIPATLVAVVTIVALSPLGPLGLARRLEFDLALRLDPAVLVSTVAAVVIFFALVGAATPIDAARRPRRHATASRLEPALRNAGPVAVVGATVARGRSSRAVIAVTALALAAGIAAGGVIASYDHLVAVPERYGAWWDVAVGQYGQQGSVDVGIAKLRANPAVIAAAGYLEDANIAKVNGTNARFLALDDYIRRNGPVMAAGRPPTVADEAALGRATARQIHKTIGDEITVVANDDKTYRLRVVGIAVVNDPVSSQAAAGDGVFVQPRVFMKIAGPGTVAQSIVIRLDSHRDRAAAIDSVRRDFSGSIRKATPQVDVRNLGRLRSLPWLIAALIGILALATLIHALVTMLGRNRTNLAVLAALGFTRRQRRGVGIFASTILVLIGVAIGIPLGLILGVRVWDAAASGTDLQSDPVLAWTTVAIATVATLGVAATVALVTSRGTIRITPSEQLHVE